MKPITEQRRQKLIADCEDGIKRLDRCLKTYGGEWRPYFESQLKRQQIALDSLKAEPFVYVNAVTVRNGVVSSLVANGVGLYDGNLPVELYAAPPVTVIKLPDHVDDAIEAAIGLLDVIEEYPDKLVPISKDGFSVNLLRSKLSEIKRLNGIK